MYDEKKIINLRDSVRGIVTGQNKGGGLYIDMKIEDEDSDKGIVTIPAFGYWCGRVRRGTWVLCTIKSWAKENRRIAVRVDSIDYGCKMTA